MPNVVSTSRAPNPRGRGEQLRHDLVDAARDLLLTTRDVTPFSLRAVAKVVGVSPTAVYRHFGSAALLVDAVLEDQADSLREQVAADERVALDVPRLIELGLRYVRWGLGNPGGYQLLFESADRLGDGGGPGTPGWDMIETLGGLLAASGERSARDAAVLAIRAWSALHGLVSLRIHKPDPPWPTTVEEEVAALTAHLFGEDGLEGAH